MNCPGVKELLSDYLDQRLTPAQAAMVRDHAKTCSDCNREVEELRKTIALIGSLDEVESSPDFLVQVNNKIDRSPSRSLLWRWIFEPIKIKLPLELAALLTVTTLALYVYHRTPELSRYSVTPARESALVAQQESREKGSEEGGQYSVGKLSPGPEAPAKKRFPSPPSEADAARADEEPRPPEVVQAPESSPAAPASVARGMSPERAMRPAKPELSDAPESSSEKTTTQAGRAARSDREMKLPVAGMAEPAKRLLEAPMSPPRPKVVEVVSEDTALFASRIKGLLPQLGGKIISERAAEDGLVLAVELPQSREQELHTALKEESDKDSANLSGYSEADSAPRQYRSRSAAPFPQKSLGQVEKSTLKGDEPTVAVELRIRPKK